LECSSEETVNAEGKGLQEMPPITRHAILVGLSLFLACVFARRVAAQENLLTNPGFEKLPDQGFFTGWDQGGMGKVNKTLFVAADGPHAGRYCLRMKGTPTTWTTCSTTPIAVEPDTTYWITWWFKAWQPASSRTYLFLQTNLGQRIFPQTDRNGDFDWTFCVVPYRTGTGEKTLAPVLTMQTTTDPPGTSWWDDVGVWRRLPPEFEAIYRQDRPWDDATVATARRLAEGEGYVVWGDRPEVRIYPHTWLPACTPIAKALRLTAPGGGHDVDQLVLSARRPMGPVSIRFSEPGGPDKMPASSLTYRVARSVPVKEVVDKTFPLGPTPDPLVEPCKPEPVKPGENAIFWMEWSPPRGSPAGLYRAEARIESDGKPLATIPLELRRWGFDLPAEPHYRSMVMISPSFIMQFYPGLSESEAYANAWAILSRYRLSGFNVAVWPAVALKDGTLATDWTRFDRIVAATKHYRAAAITLGPTFGGGCSQGWQPHKLLGLTPLADAAFDGYYIELNRQIAQRLRNAGLLERAYVYPYDEPEPDYMDKIARLCDLVHRGDPELKCLMTVDPAIARPLWGKVQAWIVPSSGLKTEVIRQRRAAGDEIWIYNMTAEIETPPIEHRLYMARALRVDARGGLLWNCCWWNKINPWENPTAAAVPVGRNWESLYHYQAGQASLFYPDPAGKGPLVPSLRLVLIRQGVEDFDMLSELAAAWQRALAPLSAPASKENLIAAARQAMIAPLVLDPATVTTSPDRTEAMRLIVGSELEAAAKAPVVITYPARIRGRLAVAGFAEPGTRLLLNRKPVAIDPDGHFQQLISAEELAAGLSWKAERTDARKRWQWAPLR
jgi:hypothetical protein